MLDQGTLSPICQFYSGRSIFITGGTGFLGRAIVYKLLSACPDIKAIYVLIRHKNGQQPEERLNKIFGSMLQTEDLTKVRPVIGDIEQADLGINKKDWQQLMENVSVVFHSAASTRLNGPLSSTLATNVFGLQHVLELSKKMPRLLAFIHVSTAYAHTNLGKGDIIEERIYDECNGLNVRQLLEVFSSIPTELLNNKDVTKGIIGTQANTYTFSKALGESLVWSSRESLPVAIIRPSIITFAFKDHANGLQDSFDTVQYGAHAIFAGGIVRAALKNLTVSNDGIPVDIVANQAIAVAWHIGGNGLSMGRKEAETNLPIYNCTMSSANPISSGDGNALLLRVVLKYSFPSLAWYPSWVARSNKVMHAICSLLFHTLPATSIDFAYHIVLKRMAIFKSFKEYYDKSMIVVRDSHPRAVPSMRWFYSIYEERAKVYSYFRDNEWLWDGANAEDLEDSLDKRDRETFPVTSRSIDWDDYAETSQKMLRKFAFRNDPGAEKRAGAVLGCFGMIHYGAMLLAVFSCLTMLLTFIRDEKK